MTTVMIFDDEEAARIEDFQWCKKEKKVRFKTDIKCISMVIAKTASRNVAFKSDKLMDALFREGQSGPQTPQTVFDADFEGLTSNAELYIFNQEDSQE